MRKIVRTIPVHTTSLHNCPSICIDTSCILVWYQSFRRIITNTERPKTLYSIPPKVYIKILGKTSTGSHSYLGCAPYMYLSVTIKQQIPDVGSIV